MSTVTPPAGEAMRFAFLDGAAIAARNIGRWALRSGFGEQNVRIVTDWGTDGKSEPVTRDRVQRAVDELFPDGAKVVEHLILSFCGHGITDASFGSVSWLFGDSLRWKYRVRADEFYAELLLKGVRRITLITDSCREGPRDLDLMRLDAVRGIAVQGTTVESPRFDTLAACQDGQLGYMVADASSAEPGKCVFSGVVADVLWGMEPNAIKDGVITTATLAACVRSRTAERAREYKVRLNPQCLIDPEAAVLYDVAKPPEGPSELQPWPPVATVASMGPVGVRAPEEATERLLERLRNEPAFRASVLGNEFAAPGGPDDLMGFVRLPEPGKELLHGLLRLRRAKRGGGARSAPDRVRAKATARSLEKDVVANARTRSARTARRSLVRLNVPDGPDAANLIVSGHDVRVWSRTVAERVRRTRSHTYFRVSDERNPHPLLVELAGGRFVPSVPYAGLYQVMSEAPNGEIIQAYGREGASKAFRRAAKALADFTAGRLDATSVDELAADLRHEKHLDPSLGAIAAYLYRAVADVDSIRRMAFYYARNDQPVPFDIALLGAMSVSRSRRGELRLRVPAVKARARSREAADLPTFVAARTEEVTATVAGRCPWLALGWDYVSTARPDVGPLVDGLAALATEIPRLGFTVLPRDVGRELAREWGLNLVVD